MPKIVGGSERVVDFEGLTIDELAGNVATKEDRISIALVKVKQPSSEPWLTLDYDEWMCVLKGRMVLLSEDGAKEMEVAAGQTVFIARGERFRPTFPDGDTEYVPVCLPAFRPDRCIREDGPESEVSAKLQKLHGDAQGKATAKAKAVDGNYTHATGVPPRLIETANHFYQDVPGEWICLEMTRTALRHCGIFVRDEEALPVGDQPVGGTWGSWICPHIIGGIPPSVVRKERIMTRDGKRFCSIDGVSA